MFPSILCDGSPEIQTWRMGMARLGRDVARIATILPESRPVVLLKTDPKGAFNEIDGEWHAT